MPLLQWIEEVRSICGPSIPVILVACKTDLRDKAIQNGTYSPDTFIDAEVVSICLAPTTFQSPPQSLRENKACLLALAKASAWLTLSPGP